VSDRLEHAVQCAGSARYAIRCRRRTLDPSHLCKDHREQTGLVELREELGTL
jgi:hypothetical protein